MQNNTKKIYTINLGKERIKINLPEESYEQLRLIQALNPNLDIDEKVIYHSLLEYVKYLHINSQPKAIRWLVRLLVYLLGEHYFKLQYCINQASKKLRRKASEFFYKTTPNVQYRPNNDARQLKKVVRNG